MDRKRGLWGPRDPKSGLRVCSSLGFLLTFGVLPINPSFRGEEDGLQCGSRFPLEAAGLSSKWGFALWSLSISVCVQRRAFFPSVPPAMLMPPRGTGAVPQECPRCVLNFGARSLNARWQREWMLFGFVWNSPPFLFSGGTQGPRPHGITKAPCEAQWEIGMFV